MRSNFADGATLFPLFFFLSFSVFFFFLSCVLSLGATCATWASERELEIKNAQVRPQKDQTKTTRRLTAAVAQQEAVSGNLILIQKLFFFSFFFSLFHPKEDEKED